MKRMKYLSKWRHYLLLLLRHHWMPVNVKIMFVLLWIVSYIGVSLCSLMPSAETSLVASVNSVNNSNKKKKKKNDNNVMSGTPNLAPRSNAGSCHLENQMTWSQDSDQRRCRIILWYNNIYIYRVRVRSRSLEMAPFDKSNLEFTFVACTFLTAFCFCFGWFSRLAEVCSVFVNILLWDYLDHFMSTWSIFTVISSKTRMVLHIY